MDKIHNFKRFYAVSIRLTYAKTACILIENFP
jgi:hypothetical protein